MALESCFVLRIFEEMMQFLELSRFFAVTLWAK